MRDLNGGFLVHLSDRGHFMIVTVVAVCAGWNDIIRWPVAVKIIIESAAQFAGGIGSDGG